MNFVTPFLSVLAIALDLWNNKEKHKYQERLSDLKRKIHEQENLSRDKIDMQYLDSLYFELQLLSVDFTTAAKKNISDS